MKSEKEIEKFIKNVQLDTHPEADRQVLSDVLAARNKAQAANTKSAGDIHAVAWRGKAIRVAAMLLVFVGIGFVLGRRQAPSSLQMEQIRVDLETSLKQSLTADMHALLRTEIGPLLAASANRTLAISETQTNQRLRELIVITEAARLKDRQQITTALVNLKTDRLQDKSLFGRNLAALAIKTHDLIEQQTMNPKGS
jgi:hypothetical protein